MPTAFVTGATGFIGRHLVDVLRENQWTIIAAARNPEKARGILGDDIDIRSADLTDYATMGDALPQAVDCVFHVAADVGTWSKFNDRQYRTNVEGTAALLQAVLDKNAKRMVHVSSIVAYGEHSDTISDETPRLGATSWVSYVNTKAYAERKVKEAVDRGLDAVIVNPTDVVGRYDDQNWARMIKMVADGSLPAVPPGNGNFANGRAVAEGILAAYHHGETGKNYILGGPYATFHDFLSVVAAKLGKPKPKKPISAGLLKFTARVMEFFSKLTGKRPAVTKEEAYFACQAYTVNYDTATEKLGYRDVPLEQSIEEAIEYLKEKGEIQERSVAGTTKAVATKQ